MADDERNRTGTSGSGSGSDAQGTTGKRTVGRGMTSPDSTQVPLRAEDGEPDPDAINGRTTPGDVDQTGRSR